MKNIERLEKLFLCLVTKYHIEDQITLQYIDRDKEYYVMIIKYWHNKDNDLYDMYSLYLEHSYKNSMRDLNRWLKQFIHGVKSYD